MAGEMEGTSINDMRREAGLPAEEMSPIERELNALRVGITQIDRDLAALFDRIDGVLAPHLDGGEKISDETPDRAPVSSMANEINLQADRLVRLSLVIQRTTNRVEL